jgi:hypothetical protein
MVPVIPLIFFIPIIHGHLMQDHFIQKFLAAMETPQRKCRTFRSSPRYGDGDFDRYII